MERTAFAKLVGDCHMNPEKRVQEYARKNFNEVYHCTLNPDGPGDPGMDPLRRRQKR